MGAGQRKQRVKNATKITVRGKDFTSKAEGYYYDILCQSLENKEIESIECQIPFELQPQFKKCQCHRCDFIWKKPSDEKHPDYKRYYGARTCPQCGSELKLHREMTYICDFLVTDLEGLEHVVDVKSSQFFQTEIFKMKKKIFEFRYPAKLLEEVYPKVPKGWGKEKVI